MKRYIRNNQYTMEHDNKMKVMQWLDIAEPEINKFCKAHSGKHYYEIDDVTWGTDYINIPIYEGWIDRPRSRRLFKEFTFRRDSNTPESAVERLLINQVHDFINYLESLVEEEDYEE